MKITFQSPPKSLDEKMLYNILRDYKMLNCEVLVRDESGTAPSVPPWSLGTANGTSSHRRRLHRRDNEGSSKVHQVVCPSPLPLLHFNPPLHTSPQHKTNPPLLTHPSSLYVYNKIDSISLPYLRSLAHEPYTAVMSCELDLGVSDVVDRAWEELALIRIYTKRKGIDPDFGDALIVRKDSTVEDVCDRIHRTLKEGFKYALVWGASARHVPQRVGLGHMVADEDVICVVSK